MVHMLALWFLVAAFTGAGIANLISARTSRSDFSRWGYPSGWGWITGGCEILSALLIALPASRILGLALGAIIITAAVATVLRHREPAHLAPLSIFVTLIGLIVLTS